MNDLNYDSYKYPRGASNNMKIKNLFIIVILGLILISIFISINNCLLQPDINKKNNKESVSNWTFMIYMSGDNWLSDIIPKNLGHIKSVGSNEDLNIIVLVDEKGVNNTHLYYIEIYDVNETSLEALNSKYYDELNMGNKQTLEDFAIWTMNNYPAKHYFLDIWGHGKGWPGVALDGNDYLTMIELDDALKNIIQNDNGNKLDIIGFDACNMGMLEIFYQIKDYANISIASEKEIPEYGWPYYDILMSLKKDSKMTPEELSRLIVTKYHYIYSTDKFKSDDLSIALSAIDLMKIDEIVDNLENVSLDKSQCISYENPDYVDLFCYARDCGSINLKMAINKSIIAEKHWSNPNGDAIEYAYGMTIYYPEVYNKNYNELKFSIDTQWDDHFKS